MCKEVIYSQNSNFRQKTIALMKRPPSGVRLQNNMKSKGEKLLHFSHLLKKALDKLNKLRIIYVRYIHFENILNFTCRQYR